MRRMLFGVFLYVCSSLVADSARNQAVTVTQFEGEPIEDIGAGPGRANCADWNTWGFFELAVPEDISSCVSAGADPNATDKGKTPLLVAVSIVATDPGTKKNQAAVVQALIANGADPNAKANERTILGAALFTHHPSHDVNFAVIRALVAAGADPNALAGPIDRWRPIHMAVLFSQDAAVTEVLLKAGADPNPKAKWGKTPLHMAQSATVAQALIAGGAEINVRDENGKTPLHYARAAVAQVFIGAGADPDGRDNSGKTPLHFAADGATAEVLLAAGSNWSARDERGLTPLHSAASTVRYRREELISVLVDAGADPNVRDASGRTPLHVFAHEADTNLLLRYASELRDEVVKPLIACGADIDARDGDGNTPLHLAAASDRMVNLVMALLDAGANGALKNARDDTPWDLARGNEWLDNAFRRSHGLEETDAYWQLNDARFETPVEAP